MENINAAIFLIIEWKKKKQLIKTVLQSDRHESVSLR